MCPRKDSTSQELGVGTNPSTHTADLILCYIWHSVWQWQWQCLYYDSDATLEVTFTTSSMRDLVSLEKASNLNTPIDPFQIIYSARANLRIFLAAVST